MSWSAKRASDGGKEQIETMGMTYSGFPIICGELADSSLAKAFIHPCFILPAQSKAVEAQ